MRILLATLLSFLCIGLAFGAESETIPIDNLNQTSIGVYREYLHSLSDTYKEYNFETFKRHPKILDAIKKVKPDFKTKDVSTAFPNHFFKTKDGRVLVVLRGCTPHDCAGTVHIIAYDTLTRKAFVLREKYDQAAVQIFGSPDDLIKQLLINVYME